MKKLFSVLLSLALVLSLFSGLSLRSSAEEPEEEGVYTLEVGMYTEVVTELGEVRNVQILPLVDVISAEDYVVLASSQDELLAGIITLYAVEDTAIPFVVLFNYLDEEHTSWEDPATGAFYAQYHQLFNIEIGEGENCTIEVDKTQAMDGESVTITVTADPYFVVESVLIEGDYYHDEYDWISYKNLSVYTCTLESMPACDITVSATAIDTRHWHEEGEDDYGPLPEGYSGGVLAEGFYLLEDTLTLTSDMIVEAGTEVFICMGGQLIDLDGHHIVNHGSLTLEDCGNAGWGSYLFEEDGEGNWNLVEDSEDEDCLFVHGACVARGQGTEGGAILSDGSLTLDNVTIALSSADIGGGVYSTGAFTMKNNALVIKCEARIAGGIYSDGQAELSNVVIDSNTASEAAGGIFAKDTTSEGGLIVSGEVIIESNKTADGKYSNLLIGDGVCVQVEENEENERMSIFFFTETTPTAGNDVAFLSAEENFLYAFHSDDRAYSVIGSEAENNIILALSAHKHEWKYRTEEGAVIAYCDDSEAHELMLEERVEMIFYGDMGYCDYPFTAWIEGNVPSENGYLAGEYELTRDDISYYQKAGDSWEPIEEAILPGDYKAVLTKEEIEFSLDFTITKGTIDWISHTQDGDIAVDETPEFYIVHEDVRYYGLYSKSEDGPFKAWDQVFDGVGTYYVKYEIPENDLYFYYSKVDSFDVCECVCWYDNEINEDLFVAFDYLILDGKMQEKRYLFAWEEEGYTIRYDDENQFFFCPDGDHVSEEPFYWQYDGTGFYYEITIPLTGGGTQAAESTLRFYLADGMTFSSTPVKAELKHRTLGVEHHRGQWSGMEDNEDGTHSFRCIYCTAEVTEKHTYDEDTNHCIYCDADRENDPITGDRKDLELGLYFILLSVGAMGVYYTGSALKRRKTL